ncbi:hypothetical protein SFC76_12395 [Sphingomonas sp. CD22]|uniref:hypothetical protein n=1 Tax=Sphingomonas sp. CD22 TaxID=3100214 RepID=UPI002ADFCCFE|nr:hypothetical protein [Sphingomonas sp. CD22]MEA1085061.1 hypothetical protein [Sphingomonas sp. CD22]
MLEDLVHDLIESFADAIVGVAVTVAEDHQARRDKLADYEAKAKGNANALGHHVAGAVQAVVRNRYKDWLADPRLGHEQPAAELRAAEIGLNEAVVALKRNRSVINRALAIGASIRMMAITEVLGVACIYDKAATRPAPIKTKRVVKPARASDKRMNRRAISIADIPPALLPLVARLRTSDPDHLTALGDLEAQRGGSNDIDGIATKLATLASLAEHQEFIDELATQAGAALTQAEPTPLPQIDKPVVPPVPVMSSESALNSVPTSTKPSSIPPVGGSDQVRPAKGNAGHAAGSVVNARPVYGAKPADNVAPAKSPVIPATTAQPAAITPEITATIKAISDFVNWNRWALREKDGQYSLGKLGKRADLNTAFDPIAKLPAMQEALARVAASPAPR